MLCAAWRWWRLARAGCARSHLLPRGELLVLCALGAGVRGLGLLHARLVQVLVGFDDALDEVQHGLVLGHGGALELGRGAQLLEDILLPEVLLVVRHAALAILARLDVGAVGDERVRRGAEDLREEQLLSTEYVPELFRSRRSRWAPPARPHQHRLLHVQRRRWCAWMSVHARTKRAGRRDEFSG